ncbi:hypothetical protein ACWEAF_35860 [Streptomyces sp. NPDC005071]
MTTPHDVVLRILVPAPLAGGKGWRWIQSQQIPDERATVHDAAELGLLLLHKAAVSADALRGERVAVIAYGMEFRKIIGRCEFAWDLDTRSYRAAGEPWSVLAYLTNQPLPARPKRLPSRFADVLSEFGGGGA